MGRVTAARAAAARSHRCSRGRVRLGRATAPERSSARPCARRGPVAGALRGPGSGGDLTPISGVKSPTFRPGPGQGPVRGRGLSGAGRGPGGRAQSWAPYAAVGGRPAPCETRPMAIEAVLFDIGGVLEYTPPTGWEQRWATELGAVARGVRAAAGTRREARVARGDHAARGRAPDRERLRARRPVA